MVRKHTENLQSFGGGMKGDIINYTISEDLVLSPSYDSDQTIYRGMYNIHQIVTSYCYLENVKVT